MSLKVLNGRFSRIHLWADPAQVESAALDQLKGIAGVPWVRRIAVMPDVHLGKGATVGSVIAMKGALSPSAVGVDIGCGMGAVRTNLRASDLPSDLAPLRSRIEGAIPVGFNAHQEAAFGHPHSTLGRKASALFHRFRFLHQDVQELEGKAMRQCGTLGGGNHFIELCLDEGICEGTKLHVCHGGVSFPRDGGATAALSCSVCGGSGRAEPRVWMMLHSGSRNVGKSLAEAHVKVAKTLDHNKLLSDPELSVFLAGTPEMEDYASDLAWAQEYAFLNREVMLHLYKGVMLDCFADVKFEQPILCHHNYVSYETHFGDELVVTRKGAIFAGKGAMGVIPGSMGTKSYIVEGLGNEESLSSASHGAGRRMSRGKARLEYTIADLAEQTAGVECRKDDGVLDEIPGAYKDIDQVMQDQKDLVKIKHTLRAVLCVKG